MKEVPRAEPCLHSSLCLTFRIALILVSSLLPIQEHHPKLEHDALLIPCALIYICKRLSEAARQRVRRLCIINVLTTVSAVAPATHSTGAKAEVHGGARRSAVNECRHTPFLFLLPSQTSLSEPCVMVVERRAYLEYSEQG